jgi:hypothetical protein
LQTFALPLGDRASIAFLKLLYLFCTLTLEIEGV